MILPKSRLSIDGETLSFDKLLIATGSTPRHLPDAMGGKLGNVFSLRDLEDADAIARQMSEGKQALIIGGGYIGLEAAAVFSTKGHESPRRRNGRADPAARGREGNL